MPRSLPSRAAFGCSPTEARFSVPVLREGVPVSRGQGLPAAGRLRLGDVDLGVGRPATAGRSAAEPELWMADDEELGAAAVWRRLVDLYPETGLWPLLLTQLGAGDHDRPWGSGELAPVPLAGVDALQAAVVLAGGWADSLVPLGEDPYVELLRPFGAAFPGLAAPLRREGPPAFVPADAVDRWGLTRLGLVRCGRPADAVALIGWSGAINRRSAQQVSAVLRSWEERFGAVLAGLGFATLTLLVPHPPADESEALPLAAELAALCPDVLSEDGPMDGFGYVAGGTVAGLARVLVDRPIWRLWWD